MAYQVPDTWPADDTVELGLLMPTQERLSVKHFKHTHHQSETSTSVEKCEKEVIAKLPTSGPPTSGLVKL